MERKLKKISALTFEPSVVDFGDQQIELMPLNTAQIRYLMLKYADVLEHLLTLIDSFGSESVDAENKLKLTDDKTIEIIKSLIDNFPKAVAELIVISNGGNTAYGVDDSFSHPYIEGQFSGDMLAVLNLPFPATVMLAKYVFDLSASDISNALGFSSVEKDAKKKKSLSQDASNG